jgi:predicted transcriptional regulator
MKQPGLSQFKISEQTGCPESAVEFHMWYFMQKGWVQREESGVLSITALGIDRIDEVNISLSQNGRRRIEA